MDTDESVSGPVTRKERLESGRCRYPECEIEYRKDEKIGTRYRWDVYINGDWRAVWSPSVYKGYTLHYSDGLGAIIRDPKAHGRYRYWSVPDKTGWNTIVYSVFRAGAIPTVEQYERRRKQREEKKQEQEKLRLDSRKQERLRGYAPQLLQMLRDVLPFVHRGLGDAQAKRAYDLILEITGTDESSDVSATQVYEKKHHGQ